MKHPRRWLAGVGGALVIGVGAGATVACTCDTPNFGGGSEDTPNFGGGSEDTPNFGGGSEAAYFTCQGPATSGCWTPDSCDVTAADSDTADLQAKMSAASAGETVCGSGAYGSLSLDNEDNASDVTVQGTDPNDAMTISFIEVALSDHWKFQGIHFANILLRANTNMTFTHNLHTAGQMELCTTEDCPSFSGGVVENANILIDHDIFTDYHETSGGAEGRLQIYGGVTERVPAGIIVQNNLFQGGYPDSCSDGMRLDGDITGTIVRYNEFLHLDQGNCAAEHPAQSPHVDPIQGFHDYASIIHHNFFFQSGTDIGSGGIEFFDGSEGDTITDNVIVTNVYPRDIACGSNGGPEDICVDTTIEHNTLLEYIGIGSGGGDTSSGNIVHNNVIIGGFLNAGGLEKIGVTESYNLCPTTQGCTGTGDIDDDPIFVGGANPKTYCGFVLDPSSPGYNAGSSGETMGITGDIC